MIPDPKPSCHWSVEAKTATQMILVNKDKLKIAVEFREAASGHYLLAAAMDRRISASAFRKALPEMFPDASWGKLPRHSREGLRAVAKVG